MIPKRKLDGEIMPDEGSNFLGAMQNPPGTRRSSDNVPNYCNNQQHSSSSSYLILSPSNPLRTFAISFLTNWIYSTVIIVTICAFVFSSTYYNFWYGEVGTESAILIWTRRIVFVVILLEILIKSLARGFLVDALSFLRLKWDWLDVFSLILIFVSMIIPCKALDSVAAAIVLLKFIPIHTGSINAFISLCSCAKNLIPVLVYWIIIVWIHGMIIFTLFAKYQQQDVFENGESSDNSVTKINGSASDSVENENITHKSHVGAFVDGDYLTPSTSKKSKNFSFGLSVECLPTNLRSLSGAIIQVWIMLTLGFSQSDLTSTISRGNISSLNKLESLCQYEVYTLSIVETLVIISGTLPMITMTFGALYDFFQRERDEITKRSLHPDGNETEQESPTSYQYHRRRRLGSNLSGRTSNSHSQNDCDEGSVCLSSSFKQLVNILCDCDYYFCCLANLQLRLSPCATRLLNSKRFKVCVLLVVSLDFLCMIMLLWFSNGEENDIDFPPTWLITYCIQTCFVLYTTEAVFKWFAVSSDEYWLSIWAAFDLFLVIVYWIGYIVIHVWSLQSLYRHFCGLLLIRMLKIVPYCKSLQHSLNVMASSLLGKLQQLFVILICSYSIILFKYAIRIPELETERSSQHSLIDNPSKLFYFHSIGDQCCHLILYFLCSAVVVCIFIQATNALKSPPEKQHVNTSVSFLLNDSYSEDLVNSHCQRPKRHLNESPSPNVSIQTFPGGISPMKYRFATSPSESNNGLFTQDTQSSMLSPTSDVLSPLLSIPSTNGLYAHVQPPFDDTCHVSEEPDIQLANESSNDQTKQDNFSHLLCSSMELVLDLVSSAVTILSSINIALDSSETVVHNMSWDSLTPGRSLWLEILFILCITAHIIYKIRLNRFSREAFLQISCVFDLLMVLAVAVEVFSSGMKWLPLKSVKVFVDCAKVLSACRGLMLFSRIFWLKTVGKNLCIVFWNIANYLTSFGYIWLVFLLCSIEAQKMITLIKMDEKGSSENDDNGKLDQNSFEKNGSISTEEEFIAHSGLVMLTILFFLLTFAGFLGLFIHKMGSWNEVISKYAFNDETSQRQSSSLGKLGLFPPVSTPHAKPTEGICVPVLYYVTNHCNFDIIVMAIILFDGLVITFEHEATSERALILRKHYPAYIIFLYLLELMSKLAGNGLNFFKSSWNVFDATLIMVSLTDFLVSLLWQDYYLPILILNLRFLRIIRIFQFQPFVQNAPLLRKFFSAVPKVYLILRNLSILYFSLFIVIIILRLRCMQFIPTEKSNVIMIAAPLQVLKGQTILEVIGNLNLANTNVEHVFFFLCLMLFSLIRISVIFSVWLVLVAILCHLLTIQNQESLRSTEINKYHELRQITVNDSVDFDDKSSYLMPCITPETTDIETPGKSATNYRVDNNSDNSSACVSTEVSTVPRNDVQNNSLYKTTTITSSEEINGCKVFYVEAMITTV